MVASSPEHPAGERRVSLLDGTPLVVRPIRADDGNALRRGFARLGPESRRRRFLSPMPQLTQRFMDYLTRIDHHDPAALVAIDATNP